jgi:hypothetical protein
MKRRHRNDSDPNSISTMRNSNRTYQVWSFMSFVSILSKILKIKYKTVILHVFYIGVQLGLSHWGQNMYIRRVFENRVLRRLCGQERGSKKILEKISCSTAEKYMMRKFVICIFTICYYDCKSSVCRWEVNVRLYLQDIGCECVDTVYLLHPEVHWWANVNIIMGFVKISVYGQELTLCMDCALTVSCWKSLDCVSSIWITLRSGILLTFLHSSTSTQGSTQPPIQWLPGHLQD